MHAKNLGKATQEALPFPWQENEGTLISVLWAEGRSAPEQKRRCAMRGSFAAYVQLLRHVLLALNRPCRITWRQCKDLLIQL